MENSGELVHLPEDITSDILRRLPVESLLRFRCVCKSWCNLIQSAQFVESHANDVNRCTRAIFFNNRSPSHLRKTRFFGFNPEYEANKLKKINLCELTHLGEDYVIHGHCNGVICLFLVDSISLWNPSLRQCRVLPPTRVFLIHLDRLGFGYDSANRDYKVVNVPSRTGGTSEMYSLKSNSWKPIHCNHLRYLEYQYFFISPRGCSFKGRLHWIVFSDPRSGRKGLFLVVFDFTVERFLEFDILESVPENHGTSHCNIGVFKGRLSWLMTNSSREYEIWSSEDDSCTPESWIRVWKCSQEAWQLNNGLRIRLIQLTEDENMLMKTDYHHGNGFVHLCVFQMKGLEVRTTVPDDPCLCFPITNFVETLVSVMPETATVPPTSSGRWNCSVDDESSVYAMP